MKRLLLALGFIGSFLGSAVAQTPPAVRPCYGNPCVGVAAGTPLPVTGSFSPSGNTVVIGPTADGSPATTAPVLTGGTVDGSASGNIGVAKVDAAGLAYNAIVNWGGTALGAMANYGTSPGAVAVPGVNAFVTNTVTVTGSVTSTSGGQYPSGAVPITISATGTTGATTATLGAAVAKSTYLCGFTITSDATAAVAGTATVTGVTGGTMSFIQNVGAATAAGILTQPFNPCLPSSATNTAIAITSVAAGVGGNTAVVAWGYQL